MQKERKEREKEENEEKGKPGIEEGEDKLAQAFFFGRCLTDWPTVTNRPLSVSCVMTCRRKMAFTCPHLLFPRAAVCQN
jgi:hypothetical protein